MRGNKKEDAERLRWTRYRGPSLIWIYQLYNAHFAALNEFHELGRMVRGAREIAPTDLPDLVTFADVDHPESVIAVDPNDLQATLGPGVRWKKITIEIEPMVGRDITRGIELKLPWLRKYFENNLRLDGSETGGGGQIANVLAWSDLTSTSGPDRRAETVAMIIVMFSMMTFISIICFFRRAVG